MVHSSFIWWGSAGVWQDSSLCGLEHIDFSLWQRLWCLTELLSALEENMIHLSCALISVVCSSQWWPVFVALLSREDSCRRGVVCGSGVWGFPGRFGTGRDCHGSLHSAARIRPGHGQPCGRLHGDARGQIPQEVCSDQGWSMCAVKHYWNLKRCIIYRSRDYVILIIVATLHTLSRW